MKDTPLQICCSVLALVLTVAISAHAGEMVISSFAASTEAPHGKGNVYAPDIVRYQDKLYLFFGGQGMDGHDRIHLATSADGRNWQQEGIVFAPEGVNHVNDPSVVVIEETLYLFYTLAATGVTDAIGLATSTDGKVWNDQGAVFVPSPSPAWDSLLVGRPSVIHDGERFHLWYDGRKDLPPGAPDPDAPKSIASQRQVGYATSRDGLKWKRRPEPVFGSDAGGIHVSKVEESFVMVIESRDGTRWAKSADGIHWQSQGLLLRSDDHSPHGHVTPFLLIGENTWHLFYGAARSAAWDQNSIYSMKLRPPST
jgi:sucrose-6-phosphate hydrolase SacC (GH32 family)